MVAPSKSEVEDLIRIAVGQAKEEIDSRFVYLLGERVSREQAQGAIALIVDEARAEFKEMSARIDRLCTDYNAQLDQHKVVIEKIVDEFKGTSAELTASVNEALLETKTLSQHVSAHRPRHGVWRADGEDHHRQRRDVELGQGPQG